MKAGTKNTVLGALLLVIIASLGFTAVTGNLSFGPAQQTSQTGTGTGTGQTGTTTTGETFYVGEINLNEACYDAFDLSALTSGTNYDFYWYAYRGGNWVLLGSGDVTDAEVTEQDGGYVYAVLTVPPKSGQTYYWDLEKMNQVTTRIDDWEFKDVTNDQIKDYVVPVYIGDKYVTEAGNPTVNIQGFLRTYEAIAFKTSPDDVASVGTAKVTKFAGWDLNFTTTKRSHLLYQYELKYNSTDKTKLVASESAVYLHGVGYIPLTSFTLSQDGTNTIYTYTVGSTVDTAKRLDYGVNQINKFDATGKLVWDLATSDVITATLTVTGLDSTGSPVSISDAVQYSA
ncbi:MAG: hypothetical protein ABIH76_08510 [Candidatus Bathyarchaeota archaeon]